MLGWKNAKNIRAAQGMDYAQVLNFLYGVTLVLSTLWVISSPNPVHAVLLLVFSFFNAAGLLILLEADFLAIMLLIVYVGAVAVLFLFVVMMMNVKVSVATFSLLRYFPIAGMASIVMAAQVLLMLESFRGTASRLFSPDGGECIADQWSNWFSLVDHQIQPVVLGNLLYTYGYDLFVLLGLVLFVAMIGAIYLALPGKSDSRSVPREPTYVVSRVGLFRNRK